MKTTNNLIENMTKKEFEALPFRGHFNTPVICDSIVILPTRRKHNSGWGCMDFVACREEKAICRLSGCSDVMGMNCMTGISEVEQLWALKGWSIDCLFKSKLLHLWSRHSYEIKCGESLSSFDITFMKRAEK